jgi:tetratricopeptide (TPR) repeat protein
MIKMVFFIQFRTQLRRTRPKLIASLEDTMTSSAVSAGGVVENGRKVLTASFDENSIGFWLDMVIFLEEACEALEKAVSELYGYALVLGRDISESVSQKLCRLSGGRDSRELSGLWCSEEITDALKYYLIFGRLLGSKKGSPNGFREVRGFRSFEGYGRKFPHRERIKKALSLDKGKNTLLLGPLFSGIKDGIYNYCESLPGDAPPLVIRFGSGAHPIVCFVDAYTPELRAFIARAAPAVLSPEELKKLDEFHERLFKERLRDEWPPGMLAQGRVFVRSLLAFYIEASVIQAPKAVLVLEDLSLAHESARLFIEAYSSILSAIKNKKDKDKILVFGADSLLEEQIKEWEGVFDRILKFTPEDSSKDGSDENFSPESFWENQRDSLPKDLLELSYCISLFARYFPAYLFPQLFEELALNPDVYERALQMLSVMGVSVFETRLIILSNSLSKERLETVHSKVRSLILSWVLSGKLNPCFNLQRILFGLGGNAGDALILKSIKADVLGGTWTGIEQAVTDDSFDSIVGIENAPLLGYIYKTLKALVWGDSARIRQAFQETAPSETNADEVPCYIGYQAQMQTNLTSFYIGSRKIESASESVRKALLLNRDLGDDKVPAYRLFSLLNLSRQRIDDAMEYISFALEQAEKAGQQEEIVLSCYFASSINLLNGNLSRSLRLAARAEETAFAIGHINWGMKAKFLRARLYFEFGRYGEAMDILKSIPAESGTDMACTVEAWLYRTKNFLGLFSSLKKNAKSSGADAKIFEIEAAYFFSDYKRAEALAEEFLSSAVPSADNFSFTDQPDWRSGFSQCEYMLQNDEKPGARLVQVYRSMAQCALNPSVETRAEILGRMQRFMRDELLPDTDPSDAVYFYAWYRMLADSLNHKDEPATQVDLNTVVSMAFKRLQRRAGKIDDAEIKQAFLSLPRWNNALYQAAREHRLI